MISLNKRERVFSWIFFVVTIVAVMTHVITQAYRAEFSPEIFLGIVFSAQLILIFVSSCPKWIYLIISILCLSQLFYLSFIAVLAFTNGFTTLAGTSMRDIMHLLMYPIHFVVSYLMIIYRFYKSRVIAIAMLALHVLNVLIYYISLDGYFLFDDIFVSFLLIFHTYDIALIIWSVGDLLGFILLLVVNLNTHRCECGYVYRSGAKFCGGCGKSIS